ncbi:MAG: efflux RND transporter permease subunit [Acidobacteria bacterium]|nr:efflux RND transporter permease subunit [Acidobacteriota bacterium]MBI3424541.1 efflux RND transporter permease subunit [Acidobacteriota bacterium]
MINKLVSFALHQPFFMILLTLLFAAAGVAAYRNLPVEAFPDVTDTQVQVITLYQGRAAEEVEKQVTIPVEIGLSGIPHAVRLFSHTQFGLSYVVVTFDDAVDAYFSRQQVLERLRDVDLPPGVEAELGALATPIGEIYRYRLKGSDGFSPTELRTLQDWVVERQLKTVPGVADVVTYGGFVKQYQVQPDLAKMRSYDITLQQLLTALDRGSTNAGGSYIEKGEQQYLIRGLGLLRSAEDIGKIVVKARKGTPLLVREIAEVKVGAVPRQGVTGQDKEDDIVTGIVLMRKGENPSAVLQTLKEKIDKLNATILPKGVAVVPIYDRTWLIGTTLRTVFKNLAEGATLVALVLLLFLGNVRAALIVAIMIPLSLMATFLGLTWRGIPANLLSLGAMDFGIIVDGAVIVVENIFRELSEHAHQHDFSRDHNVFKAAIQKATNEVGRPTFFSMLIIITAHIPIFTLQRHEGRIFAPMAWTVTSALVGSLIFSLTLVPLLCYFLLRRGISEKENFIVRFCHRLYAPVLAFALKHRLIVIGLAVIMLAVSIATVPKLGSEFLPELNEGTLWVNIYYPPGISVSETMRLAKRVREILGKYPVVRSVVSKAGRPEDGTDPKPINMAEFFVDLKPPEEWPAGLTHEKLVEEMDKALDEVPGIEPSFSQPIRDNVLESISQIDGQIVVKVFGPDGDVLREQTDKILAAITPIKGVARAFIDRFGQVPQLQIEINRDQAARYGLNIADVQDVIETALGGKKTTEIWEGERKFPVVVRLDEAERRMDRIKNILVDTPDGLRIPLEQLTDISIKNGSMNISRELGTRVMAIGVFIRDRDMGSLVAEMQDKVDKAIKLPNGYNVTWGGEFENQQRAMKQLALIVPVSVLLIFALLFNAFGSAKSALLILLNVPFALIGGIFALLFTGIHLSVSAAIGFIALFGQAVLNGVVMVSYFNQLREAGLSPLEAVKRGAQTRLRTVLMTALLAMLGLLPMALSHGIGSEVQKPLAVVIIGGLVSATLLTLFVLPALYLLFERADPRPQPPAVLAEIPSHEAERELVNV